MNKKPKYNEIIFTEEQKQEIIDMYTNHGCSTVLIGKEFGVSHKTIARLLEKNGIARSYVGNRRYHFDEHYFDFIDTPNKAYILGLLYADGYNSVDKWTIRIQLQYTDKEILELIKKELKLEKPLKFVKCSNKVASNGFISKDMYSLEFYSKHMCKTLERLGMVQNKSLVLEFPDFLDKDLYSHFIRGYYDGDGSLCNHFTKKGWFQSLLTITSTNNFCTRCLDIIREYSGISGGGIYDSSGHNGITKVLSISGTNQTKAVLDWLYTDAELFLRRKYDLYIDFITT